MVESCQWKFFDRVIRMELRGSAVDDQAMPKLDGLRCLESLTFTGTRVSDQWIQRFRELHPECVVIKDGEFRNDLQVVNWPPTY